MGNLNMKSQGILGLTALLVLASQALAAPSSQVAWTPETRRLVDGGDAVKGKELSQQCAGCHGQAGVSSDPAYPDLAGQLATYTFKQLRDYKDGSRANPLMGAFAKGLSDQDMADLGVYYASLPLPGPKATAGDLRLVARLISDGDGARLIPGCAYCHGRGGQGMAIDVPALAGQNSTYLKQTLTAFKSGQRGNDIYRRMRLMAEQLTDQEIDLLAKYYAGLSP
jgi:cytochrome c553